MPTYINYYKCVLQAWKEFDDDGRMKPSSYRDRVVDVIEEYYKFHVINRYTSLLYIAHLYAYNFLVLFWNIYNYILIMRS